MQYREVIPVAGEPVPPGTEYLGNRDRHWPSTDAGVFGDLSERLYSAGYRWRCPVPDPLIAELQAELTRLLAALDSNNQIHEAMVLELRERNRRIAVTLSETPDTERLQDENDRLRNALAQIASLGSGRLDNMEIAWSAMGISEAALSPHAVADPGEQESSQ